MGPTSGATPASTSRSRSPRRSAVNLAIQTSVEAKFDNRPGPLKIANLAPGFVPEASSLDTIMKASLIYSFFTKKDDKKKADKK